MGGLGTYNGRPMLGFRWIFISMSSLADRHWPYVDAAGSSVMALMTITAAFIGYAVIPNFPAKATFLTEEERQLVQDRINVDRRDFENEHLTKAGVFKALSDWKIWCMVS